MSSTLPSPTGPHSQQEGTSTGRFERKIRRTFSKMVGTAPAAADRMTELMYSENPMVSFLATKFVLSAVGLGEISKQVQKSTQEIRMETRTRVVEETVARLAGPGVDDLLAELETRLAGHLIEATPVEGEVIDATPEPAREPAPGASR